MDFRRLTAWVLISLSAGALLVWLAPQLALFAIAGWIHAETGRSLVAQGVSIQWGREPTLDLRGVRLANARWSPTPWMMEIDHLRLRATLGGLLRGEGRLAAFELDGAVLLLEVHDGIANWDFSDRPAPFMALGGSGGLPRIESVRLRDLRVRFHDPAREQDILGTVTGAAGNLGTPDWRIQGQGTLDFKALTFQLQGRGEVLEVAVDLGDTSLLARGSPRRGRFAIEAHGADLRHAFPVIPIPFPSTPAYRFRGRLERAGDGVWQMRALTGVIGDTDLAGTLDVTPGAPSHVTGQLHSHTLHLRDLKGFVGIPVRGPPPRPGKLFPETPIDRKRFFRVRLTLDYVADRVSDGRLPMQGLSTRVTIDRGWLELSPFRLFLADGPAHGSATLDVRGPLPRASFQLDLDGGRLSALFAHLPLLDASRGLLHGALRLQGSGQSLAGIFGASRGELVLLMTDGALDRRFVDALDGDLLQLLFSSKGETADLSCAVAVFHVSQGVAQADAVVAETSRALITGKGRVDLGRERFDLKLAARPRDPGALSSPTPLSLSGSFTDPQLAADTSALAGRTVAAVTLGALLGPLAALAPFTSEGSEQSGECARMLHG